MSAFDTTWQVLGASIGVPPEDDPNGALELMLTVGALIPTPQGSMPFQLGVLRFPFGREQAINLFKRGLEEAEKMPQKVDIATAASMSQVSQMADEITKITGK